MLQPRLNSCACVVARAECNNRLYERSRPRRTSFIRCSVVGVGDACFDGASRQFWNVRVMRVSRALRGSRPTPSYRRKRTWLNHGFHHVCDAFRGSRLRDARHACDVLAHHYGRRSSPRHTMRSGPFACGCCGSCPRDE
jgi:hypothetical protein